MAVTQPGRTGRLQTQRIISRWRIFKAIILTCPVFVIIISTYMGLKPTNLKPESKSYMSHQPRIVFDQGNPTTSEVRHVAFLKVHKAGSSTVQNIMYRFGLARNLTFVLPREGHYISSGKFEYWPVLPLSNESTEDGWKKYDILCNHAVFNLEKFREFVHEDAAYVAIVREPLTLFTSAANYYRYVYQVEYLTNITENNFLPELIHNYTLHEPQNATYTKTFNLMTRDFGFVIGSPVNVRYVAEEEFNEFIDGIKNVFKLVLVLEKFDESLVLLKRRLRWTFKDILYLKQNVFDARMYNITSNNTALVSKSNLTPVDIAAFNRSHWMDSRIYETFSKQLEDQIAKERNFHKEVVIFKVYLRDVQTFCEQVQTQRVVDPVMFKGSYWSEAFTVSAADCGLMMMDELAFSEKLSSRHKSLFNV